ncbi:hypothetical protein EY643_05435 [Halioglobus maricola]|uniref:Uncharacterized protein n=1 Tax=Halioglobus maricola TaxID=2601894 RepID=A0A5P9NHY3_9GAMM|nr:hypothetical protein [Halioglobus maricola]QFU75136.1 hypothetical protein EY643_05435 [Halioglobus maricola]
MQLKDLIEPRAKLAQQAKRIRELEQELVTLKAQNDSMRDGMRRCVTCEYRIDYKARQGQSTEE